MSSYRVKLRRGTTAETSVFTGEVGEVTVDTTKKTLVVHDGTTRGGHPLPRDTDVKTDLNQLTDNYGLLQSYVDGFTGSTEVYAITVAPDSSGNNNVFYITGLENPHIVLTPGNRYVFDVSDSSNTGHPLYFTADDGVTNYTTNVSRIGTEGTAGAKVIFIIPADVPALKYYCSVHGLSMGNQISSVLNTPSSGGGSSSLASFDISPALPTGETSWNLATDGDLSITEAGNWTFTATTDGTVDLSMKGAGGGYGKDTNALGGTGGLTSGKISVSAGDVFKVTVGSKGVQSGGAGAYGGGGAGGNLTLPGSGGGYSGIFEGNEQQSKSILIAGGGGGGHGWDAGSATGNGGSGGGADGLAGTAGSSGGGATQTSGGAGAGNGTSGTPLTGGTGGNRSTNQGSGGGGGGGYFGGGGGAAGSYNGNQNGTPGGGGSGYIGGTSNFAVTDGVTTAGSGSTTEVDGTFSMVGQVATTEETPTVTTPTVISDSSETIFHLTTDGAAGVNTEFADSSSTAATVTAGGSSVQLSTFSPYRHGGYSTYFDGTGDHITIPNNSGTPFDFGTDNFTIEGWFYLTTSGSWTSYWGISQGGGPAQKINLYDSSGDGTLDIDVDGSVVFSSSAVLTDLQNKWAHIALVREGTGANQTKLYVNGSVVGQGTVSTNFSGFTQPFIIGHNGELYSGAFNGYISDFRIVSSAVYTEAFTPPTERLTAISGTELLTCHLPYIADGSTNSNTITINGNTKTEPFSPYDRVGYNEDLHGGSVYFDQTGVSHATVSRLQVGSASPDYDLSGGGTVEGWVHLNSYGNNSFPNENRPLWCFYNTSYNGVTKYYSLNVDSTGYLAIKKDYNGHTMTVSTTKIPLHTWVHVAFTTTGTNGTNKFYVNGKDVTSSFAGDTTLGGYFPGSTGNNDYELWVGAIKYAYNGKDYIAGMDGYISDLRVFKGDVLYSGDFTPPTASLESTDTAAHIKGVEGHIIDKAQSDNKLTLVGNTTASTAESKYAGSSIYFDGTGDTIQVDSEVGNFGTGDFTIEMWLRPSDMNYKCIFRKTTSSGSSSPPSISAYMVNGDLFVGVNDGSTHGSWIQAGSTVLTVDTWHHLAITRNNGNVTVFVDGNSVASGTSNANVDNSTTLRLGEWRNPGEYFIGYMEDIRFTKGLARYTENFTVPDAALESPQTTGGGAYIVATGGTITTDGNYKYHTFTGDGTFSVTGLGTNNTIDVLAVGGGGGGGGSSDSNSGGGGAGGYLEGSITAEVQSYDIVIGQGGTGGVADVGTSGGDTTISVLNATALGGGYGGGGARSLQKAAAQGGSGGGGGGFPNDMSGGAGMQGDSGGLTGYGNAGGSIGSYSSDGGGGAGQAGGTNANSAGGDGRQWLDGNYYAGGGSGGAGNLAGGLGGGGAGSNGSGNGANATANTGGGGGGSYASGSSSSSTGGNGGSGVVIFRYPYQGAETETAPTSTSYRYMKVVLNSVSSGTQAQVTEISFTGENGATDFITGQTITDWYGTGSTATSQSPTIALVNNAQSPQNSEHTNLDTLPFTLEYDLGASYVHGTELRYLQLGSSDSAYRYPTSVTVYGATQPDFSDEVALITNSAQAYTSVNSNTLIDLGTSITGGSAGPAAPAVLTPNVVQNNVNYSNPGVAYVNNLATPDQKLLYSIPVSTWNSWDKVEIVFDAQVWNQDSFPSLFDLTGGNTTTMRSYIRANRNGVYAGGVSGTYSSDSTGWVSNWTEWNTFTITVDMSQSTDNSTISANGVVKLTGTAPQTWTGAGGTSDIYISFFQMAETSNSDNGIVAYIDNIYIKGYINDVLTDQFYEDFS